MALNSDAFAAMGNGLASAATQAALHYLGSEVSAAKQAITWTVNGANTTISAAENFTGPADQPVDAVGLYSGDGLTFYGEVPITSGDLVLNAAGEYTLDDLDVNFS